MRLGASVWVLAGLLAAGCLGANHAQPPALPSTAAVHPIDVVPVGQMAAGGSYLLQLLPGGLELRSTGSLAATLLGPDGLLAGRIDLGGDGGSTAIPLSAGTYVLHVDLLRGNLTVLSDGVPVTSVRAVATYQVRAVVAQAHSAPLPANPLAANPMTAHVPMRLPMAPLGLHVLSSGPHAGLHVTVTGRGGPLVDVRSAQGPPVDSGVLREVAGNVSWDNVRDGALTVTAQADDFDGTLVVAADLPSTALAVWPPGIAAGASANAFTYGEVPRDPSGFTVAASATHLFLEPGNASTPVHVTLFTPEDRKLADVAVASGPVSIPVAQAGEYVAVADGPVTLASDAVPSDFAFHALSATSWTVAGNLPPQGYGHDSGAAAPTGIPYAVLPGRPFGPLGVPLPCTESGTLTLLQDGQPILFVDGAHDAPDANVTWRATARLDGTPLTYDADGPGLCPTPSVELRTYARPSP